MSPDAVGASEPPAAGQTDPTQVLDVRYEAHGRVLLQLPPATQGTPAPLLLGIHGYGQEPASWLAWLRSVAPAHVAVAVPCGPETWYRRPSQGAKAGSGQAWMGASQRAPYDARNDRYLDAVRRALGAEPRLDASRFVLAGFSQGVGVALHYACGPRAGLRALVGLAGGLAQAYRPRLSALAGLPVLWISGTQDGSYPPTYTDALVAEFERAGVQVEPLALDAGHDLLDPAVPPTRAFLGRHLSNAPQFEA